MSDTSAPNENSGETVNEEELENREGAQTSTVEGQDSEEAGEGVDASVEGDEAGAESDSSGAGEQKDQKKPPRRDRRIQELLAERNAAARMAQRSSDAAEEARRALHELQSKPAQIATTEDYIRAEIEKSSAQQHVKSAESQIKVAQDQSFQAAKQAWNAAIEVARDRLPADFDKLVYADTLITTPTMADAVVDEGEYGPDIAYRLAKDPREAARIAALTPIGQAMAIARLGARIAAEVETKKPPAKPPVKTTQAPEPVKAVKGRGQPTKDPEKMTHEEYKAWRGYK